MAASAPLLFTLGTSEARAIRVYEDGARRTDLSAISRWTATLAGVTVDSDANPECFDWTSAGAVDADGTSDVLVLLFGTLDLELGDTSLSLTYYDPDHTLGRQLDTILPAFVQGAASGAPPVSLPTVSSTDVSLSGVPGKYLSDLIDGGTVPIVPGAIGSVRLVSPVPSIANHGDADVVGSLAWALANYDAVTLCAGAYATAGSLSIPSGKTLHLDPGAVLTVAGSVVLSDGVTISSPYPGAGAIKSGSNLTGAFIDGMAGVDNITLRNVTIDTDKETRSGLAVVVYINRDATGSNVLIEGVYVPGSASGGITVDKTDNVVVRHCEIHDTVNDAIRLGTCTNFHVQGNRCLDLSNMASNKRGIQIGASEGGTVTGNLVVGVPSGGAMAFDFGGTTYLAMSGNTALDCGAGIDLENGSAHIAIAGNTFSGKGLNVSGDIGVWLISGGCHDITISGNTFENLYSAVKVEGQDGVSIVGNTILTMQSSAIAVVQASAVESTNISIIGNTIKNASASGGGAAPSISIRASTGVVAGNMISGTNHSYGIADNATNNNVQFVGNVSSNGTSGTDFSGTKTGQGTNIGKTRIFWTTGSPESLVTAAPGGLALSAGTAKIFTANASTDTLTSTGHGYTNGLVVWVTSTGTVPAGLSATTPYYVVNAATDTFQVSLTLGGAAVDITSTGSGTHRVQSAVPGTTAYLKRGGFSNTGWVPLGGQAAYVNPATATAGQIATALIASGLMAAS